MWKSLPISSIIRYRHVSHVVEESQKIMMILGRETSLVRLPPFALSSAKESVGSLVSFSWRGREEWKRTAFLFLICESALACVIFVGQKLKIGLSFVCSYFLSSRGDNKRNSTAARPYHSAHTIPTGKLCERGGGLHLGPKITGKNLQWNVDNGITDSPYLRSIFPVQFCHKPTCADSFS
jgi:hypothetical protein